MNKEFHTFDLDGTLWNIKSEIWVIDKEKPYKPIVTIDGLEFSLIKNGFYFRDDIPLEYNGEKFYISKSLFDKIYKKTGFENIKRLGISFQGFYDKEKLNKSKISFLLDNISHLRGKSVDIGLLTARSNQRNHSDVVNKLRLELKNMNLSIDKIYFMGDKFKVTHDTQMSLKKTYILLEHLIGFKIKDNRFIPIKQDWYMDVHFYDDNFTNISYANDCQKILTDLISKTDNDLFKIIVDRINSEELILHTHTITNNKNNPFKDNIVKIEEPEKFPLKLENVNEEFNNPFIKGKDRVIIDRIYDELKEVLDNDLDYECVTKYGNWGFGFDSKYYQTITFTKNGKEITVEVDHRVTTMDITIRIVNNDNEDEEDDQLPTKVTTIPKYSYKIIKIISDLCKKQKRRDKEEEKIKKREKIDRDKDDILDILDENIKKFGDIYEGLKEKKYYKVVTQDLKSLGLRNNPTRMTFPINEWVEEPNPQEGPGGFGGVGGVWVAQDLSGARSLKKYMDKKSIKENREDLKHCRIFETKIGDILYENSYRVKTDKVKMTKEIL